MCCVSRIRISQNRLRTGSSHFVLEESERFSHACSIDIITYASATNTLTDGVVRAQRARERRRGEIYASERNIIVAHVMRCGQHTHTYTMQTARQSPGVTRWIGRGTVTNESMHVDEATGFNTAKPFFSPILG